MSRVTDNKGQIHTLEGLMASIIMLLVLVMVINNTAVTPLSSSTTNKHVQLELMNMGEDLLASLDYTHDPTTCPNTPLKEAILEWNGDQFVWNGKYFKDVSPPNAIYTDMNNTTFAETLNSTFSQLGIAYDVEIVYFTNGTNAIAKKMIWNGDPSDNSVTVTRMVMFHDDDKMNIVGPIGGNTPCVFSPNPNGIPDADKDTIPGAKGFYNIVYVRLTLWRM